MFCEKCGKEVNEDMAFCPYCGAKTEKNNDAGIYTPPTCGKQIYTPPVYDTPPVPPAPTEPQMGMKWYKFIIYFQLFAGAIIGVGNGLSFCLGTKYGADAELIYEIYAGLKAVDCIYGLFLIGTGVCAIITRQLLAKYKELGVKMYLILMGAGIVASIAYSLTVSAIINVNSVTPQVIGNAMGSLVMIILSYIYFKKRDMLFHL